MFVKVHKPLKLSGGDNKGKSTNLMDYLDKENEGKEDGDKEQFFNDEKDSITKIKAENIIDGNSKRMKENETKFYMFSINPSSREQKHLEGLVSKEFDKNKPEHVKKFDNLLKGYTKDIMNVYANSFTRRDKNGNEIKLNSKDFAYTAKLEKERSFKHWEKEVKHNKGVKNNILKLKESLKESKNLLSNKVINDKIETLEKDYIRQNSEGKLQKNEGAIIKQDLAKSGRNSHVHVVVSKQSKSLWYGGERIIDGDGNNLTEDKNKLDKARPISLSPMSKSKGSSKNHKLNGKAVSVGFHHEKFKKDSGEVFNNKFNYKPNEKEQYNYKEDLNKTATKAVNKVKGKVIGQAKGTIVKEIRGNVAKTEEKVLKSMMKPKASIKSNVKAKIKEILKASMLEK